MPEINISKILNKFSNFFPHLRKRLKYHVEGNEVVKEERWIDCEDEVKDFLRTSLEQILEEVRLEKKDNYVAGLGDMGRENEIWLEGYNLAVEDLDKKINKLKL